MKSTIKYMDFLDLNYKPKKSDLICLFRLEPTKGFSMKECAARVASESSNGTWASLNVPSHIRALSAKVFEIKGNFAKIAYPLDLFEKNNMPQILSSIAGNIFGMKAVDNLRLEDIKWPKKLIKSFRGPQFGIKGIRKIFKVKERPLTASVPKPKVGYYTKEHAKVCYDIWTGGLDLAKDDENLTSQRFNKFERRLKETMKMREKAEKETGEKKSYLINITAETKEMLRRAKMVKDYGNEYVMVDIMTTGWSAVQTVREECQHLKLAIHGHRAFHAAFDRNPRHGMSMKVIAEIARIQGVDQIHIGGLGKLAGSKEEVFDVWSKCEEKKVESKKDVLEQDWFGVKPVMGVCSGGLHPGIFKPLVNLLGKNIIIQAGGGVHGHPNGTFSGAKAVRQTIDAIMEGTSLEKYAKQHEELKLSLDKWHHTVPK